MNIAQEVIWSLPHIWDFSVLGALHHGSSPHAFSRAHLMSMSLHDWWEVWFLLGSIWIGLILLKLKIYCWNHCSKIIFKCVNNAVRPIFNEKIDKKWICGSVNSARMYCSQKTSQKLWLPFMYRIWTVATCGEKTRVKKKKKKKEGRQKQNPDANPNIT